MIQKQNLLITGSLGFIASNLTRKIKHDNAPYNLIGIDKITKLSSINTIYNSQDYARNFHIADISDEHTMNVLFQYEKPELVIHLGASTHVDESLNTPNAFIQNNVLGTQVVVNMCVKHKVKKLVYCSTDECYGSLKSESDPSWKESDPINPLNPYSASKAAGELIVKAAANSFGLNYCITRSSNNYGRRQTSDKMIPKVIKCILNDQKIPVYGNGQNVRDWLHVESNIEGIMLVLEKGINGEIYNIGANQELSNIELVQRICNIMEKGHDQVEFVEDRKGHDFRYAIDSTKIKALGWENKIKLKDGLKNTISWYLANKYYL